MGRAGSWGEENGINCDPVDTKEGKSTWAEPVHGGKNGINHNPVDTKEGKSTWVEPVHGGIGIGLLRDPVDTKD